MADLVELLDRIDLVDLAGEGVGALFYDVTIWTRGRHALLPLRAARLSVRASRLGRHVRRRAPAPRGRTRTEPGRAGYRRDGCRWAPWLLDRLDEHWEWVGDKD